jgi:hypothetical protein
VKRSIEPQQAHSIGSLRETIQQKIDALQEVYSRGTVANRATVSRFHSLAFL